MSLTTIMIQFLRDFLMSEELLEYRVDSKSFTRRRKLPLWRVVVLILYKWKESLQNRVNQFFTYLGEVEEVATSVAFWKARRNKRRDSREVLPTV